MAESTEQVTTLVVSIGHNVGDASTLTAPASWPEDATLGDLDLKQGDALPLYAIEGFERRVRNLLAKFGELVFEGRGHGTYEGTRERSTTFIVSVSEDWGRDADELAELLRYRCALWCRAYGQECIAVTMGRAMFYGPNTTPEDIG